MPYGIRFLACAALVAGSVSYVCFRMANGSLLGAFGWKGDAKVAALSSAEATGSYRRSKRSEDETVALTSDDKHDDGNSKAAVSSMDAARHGGKADASNVEDTLANSGGHGEDNNAKGAPANFGGHDDDSNVPTTSPGATQKRFNRHLIFDVGFNTGGDSQTYLLQGYNVLAVEANPELIAKAKSHYFFSKMIASGRLTLINYAVVKPGGPNNITFWRILNPEYEGVFGTVAHEGILQQCHRKYRCEKVQVPTIDCAQLIKTYGVPLYIKIDIEGQDCNCIDSLPRTQLSPYLSFEWGGSCDSAVFTRLRNLGYSWFKRVCQLDYNKRSEYAVGQTSGPFGQFAQDYKTGMTWKSFQDFVDDKKPRCKDPGDWMDVHAMLGGSPSKLIK